MSRHDIPGESLGEALSSVTKRDTFAAVEFTELVQIGRKLIDRLFVALSGSVEYERAVLKGVRNVALYIGAEAAQISGDGWQTEREALKGGISPRLVVAREYTHVTSAHELFVVEAEEA